MDSGSIVTLVVGLLTFSGGIITLFVGRRKLQAETQKIKSESDLNQAGKLNTFTDAIDKLTNNNTSLQERNQSLYSENVALEKKMTDLERSRQNLAERLQERDEHILTLTSHLKTLQDRDRQGEITSAFAAQQEAIIQISEAYKQIIQDREKIIRNLVARTGPLPDPGSDNK